MLDVQGGVTCLVAVMTEDVGVTTDVSAGAVFAQPAPSKVSARKEAKMRVFIGASSECHIAEKLTTLPTAE